MAAGSFRLPNLVGELAPNFDLLTTHVKVFFVQMCGQLLVPKQDKHVTLHEKKVGSFCP